MSTCTIDEHIDALLGYGARIIPVYRGDKRPMGASWPTLATNNHDVIAGWLELHNIGIALGHGGLIDLEYDDLPGREMYEQLQTVDGRLLADIATPCWESDRGHHQLFRVVGELPQRGWVKRGGLEIRLGGKPAQSVLPPSLHPSGRNYRWLASPSQHEPAVLTSADLASICGW